MGRQERAVAAGKHTRIRWVAAAVLATTVVLALAPFSFSGAGWSVRVNISPSTHSNHSAQIALDSSGNPHVVWTGNEGASTARVYYSENTGSGWTLPVNLSPGNTLSSSPQLALDPDGNAHVVWQGRDGSIDRVYYSRHTGNGWTAQLNLSPATTANGKPQLALDPDGNPHVVWQGTDGPNNRVYYSANTGSGWSAPHNLSSSLLSNWIPQVKVDQRGSPHVVWQSSFLVYYSANTGSGWSIPQNVSTSFSNNYNPEMALDPDGNPHVVWHGYDGAAWRAWYSEDTGSGWTTPENISPGISGCQSPQIALDSIGNPHAVWYGDDGGSVQRAWYSKGTGSGWTTPQNLSPGSTGNINPQIALDPGGNPHVVWSGSDGSTDRIYYSKNIGSGWTNPLNLSTGITNNNYPRVALDGGGNPRVAWAGDDEGSLNRIWYTQDEQEAFYFAEGYTGPGFQEYLCLGNPSTSDLPVDVTYLFTDGTSLEKTYNVPALSRITADVNAEVGEGREVSIKCEAVSSFVAERPMYFEYTGGGGSWTGGSDAVGATLPSVAWYFAEGYTGPGFDEWICVLNPGDIAANLTFDFQTQEAGLVVPAGAYTVPAHSRATFKANDLLEGQSYQTSLKLTSDAPVVAERPMYFDYAGTGSWGWTGGHDVMGVPALARDYYFAEGYTGPGFEEWLTLQNPGTAAISVHAVYQLASGAPVEKDYPIPAASRATVYVPEEVGEGQDVSVHLSSASVFLAERPMYFDYQGMGSWGWTGGHCVIGATGPGTSWFFAEGYTGAGFEEWLCIQNPGSTEARVHITYCPEEGDPITSSHTVPALSRYTVYVNSDAGEGLAISTAIASDRPLIVERPMYFDFQGKWNGGSDVMGYQP